MLIKVYPYSRSIMLRKWEFRFSFCKSTAGSSRDNGQINAFEGDNNGIYFVCKIYKNIIGI